MAKAYSESTSIADQSDMYIVCMDRLMSPVMTFAYSFVLRM